MKERPMLFSGPLVRKILSGEKTQTRRVIKPSWSRCLDLDDPEDIAKAIEQSPYGRVGERLWVRETWAHDAPDLDACKRAFEDACGGSWYGPYYRATEVSPDTLRWRPSIHMPRWASRIDLEVTSVRVERLQAITEDDARAEGVEVPEDATAVETFRLLWDSINGKREGCAWANNPWVCVVSFRRVRP